MNTIATRPTLLSPAKPGRPDSAREQNDMRALANRLRNISGGRGIVVTQTTNGTVIALSSEVYRQLTQSVRFLARITGATATSIDTRWTYAFEEVVLDSNGNDSLATDGYTGTGAINLREINNVTQGSGVQGNSVDDSGDDYPAGFSLKPVGQDGDNKVVVVMTRESKPDGTVMYYFEYENADDGPCEAA